MLTIVRDRQYISLTLDPQVSVIHPAVQWFKELATQWDLDNADRLASTLGELLFSAVAERKPRDGSGEMHCQIERTSEGPFRITVVEEGYRFHCETVTARSAARRACQRVRIGIRRLFREVQSHTQDSRLTALVDTAGAVTTAWPSVRGRVTIFERRTRTSDGRNRQVGDGIHA
jgi:hypothetical protein